MFASADRFMSTIETNDWNPHILVHNHIDQYRLPTNHSAYEALPRSLCLTNPNSAADAQRSTQLA